MKINSDINILGGLPDFGLILIFLNELNSVDNDVVRGDSFTKIRTEKSIRRFEKAIKSTLLNFNNSNSKTLLTNILVNEGITHDSLLMLFWNASLNNDLLYCINSNVFFPAFYSGRLILKQDEVSSYLKDLKTREKELKKWSESTIKITASKYLTLLKKFTLLEGSISKLIKHPFLDDKLFVLYLYWLLAIEAKPNILESRWLQYAFYEKEFFIERILQKKFSKFIEVNYTGDKLYIRPLIEYQNIYYATTQS